MSVLLLTFLVPAVVFGAIAGVFVDTLRRRADPGLSRTSRVALLFLLLVFFDDQLVAALRHHRHRGHADDVLRAGRGGDDPAARQARAADDRERPVRLRAAGIVRARVRGPGPAGNKLVGTRDADRHRRGARTWLARPLCWILPSAPGEPARARPRWRQARSAVAATIAQLREGIGYIRDHHNIFWSLTYLAITASLIGVLGVLGPGIRRAACWGSTEGDFVDRRAAAGRRAGAWASWCSTCTASTCPPAPHRGWADRPGRLAARPRRWPSAWASPSPATASRCS